MKFVTFKIGEEINYGIVSENKVIPIEEIIPFIELKSKPPSLKDFINEISKKEDYLKSLDEILQKHIFKQIPLTEIKLLPPIPNPSKIIAIGLNYEDYRKILGLPFPKVPTFFLKAPSTLIGHEDEILVPKGLGGIFHEWEIAMIISKKAKQIGKSKIEEHVFGFTIFNDITGHELEMIENRRYQPLAKNIDTYGPLGPWISTLDEFEHGVNNIKMIRKVNGETVCISSTNQMRFSFETILQYISSFITLYPGDIISTGSPPTNYIKNGDVIEVEVEGIGVLRNFVKEIKVDLSLAKEFGLY